MFASLDCVSVVQEQFSEVLDAMFEVLVQPQDHVIDQGDDGDNFYVIERYVTVDVIFPSFLFLIKLQKQTNYLHYPYKVSSRSCHCAHMQTERIMCMTSSFSQYRVSVVYSQMITVLFENGVVM